MLDFLYRLFPPPKYLDFPVIGLDVSDLSVKYTELETTTEGIRLKRAGRRELPSGIVVSGEIKKPDELSAVLSSFLKPLDVRFAVASLPEERAYISVMTLPDTEKEEIKEAVELELPEKIPLPAGEVIFDFEFLQTPAISDRGTKIKEDRVPHKDALVYAFPKKMAQTYLDTFLKAGIRPVSFVIETAALNRALMPENKKVPPAMLVDFGKTRTTFVIVAGGLVRFSSTVSVAGESLDKAISKALNISQKEAEAVKKERGMLRSEENRAVFEALLPVVSAVADEIERHTLFWNTHAEHVHGESPQISSIILSGGDANLIGLKEYLSLKLRLEVRHANPWQNIAPFEKYIPEITFNESLSYSSALGLGLMALNKEL